MINRNKFNNYLEVMHLKILNNNSNKIVLNYHLNE